MWSDRQFSVKLLKGWPHYLGRKLLTFQRSDGRFVWLLAVVALLIILNPFLPHLNLGRYLLSLLFTFIVLSGIAIARNERQVFRQLLVVGLITLVLDWLRTVTPQAPLGLTVLVLLLYTMFLVVVTMTTLLKVLKSQRVTANLICGAIAVYLLIGLIGALVATLLESIATGTFLAGGDILDPATRFDSLLYYSMITLSTIGYGDITPNAPAAQSLSVGLGVLGQIYLTVIVAVLIGKYLKDG